MATGLRFGAYAVIVWTTYGAAPVRHDLGKLPCQISLRGAVVVWNHTFYRVVVSIAITGLSA